MLRAMSLLESTKGAIMLSRAMKKSHCPKRRLLYIFVLSHKVQTCIRSATAVAASTSCWHCAALLLATLVQYNLWQPEAPIETGKRNYLTAPSEKPRSELYQPAVAQRKSIVCSSPPTLSWGLSATHTLVNLEIQWWMWLIAVHSSISVHPAV